jgi:hypothetical protein
VIQIREALFIPHLTIVIKSKQEPIKFVVLNPAYQYIFSNWDMQKCDIHRSVLVLRRVTKLCNGAVGQHSFIIIIIIIIYLFIV